MRTELPDWSGEDLARAFAGDDHALTALELLSPDDLAKTLSWVNWHGAYPARMRAVAKLREHLGREPIEFTGPLGS